MAMIFEDQIFSGLYQKIDSSAFSSSSSSYSSLGFMEILGMNDHHDQSHLNFALFEGEYPTPPPAQLSPVPELSEVVNTPVTITTSSNSPSISYSSNDDPSQRTKAVNKEQHEDHQDNNKTKIELKARKKNTKREREPRFAFMTKSEVDHLDDGYRWRKYGQKAVKNSPFPRSYYRCTTTSCGVKKRVERSCDDSSIVVTTYEGMHTHPCPVGSYHGGQNIGLLTQENTMFGVDRSRFIVQQPSAYQQQQSYYRSQTPILNFQTSNMLSSTTKEVYQGLIQDIVSTQMQKEPKHECN